MKPIKQYRPLAASLLFLACTQAHAIAVTNVEISTPIASSLTNLSLVSESKTPYATNDYIDSSTYGVGAPYLKVTDDKKGTITTELLQNQQTTTTSYKTDNASGYFYVDTNTAASSIFRLNATVSFDPALNKLNQYGDSYGSFFMGIGGNLVGTGAPLSEVPGLTSYQAPVWAFSVNGEAYQQLATTFNVNSGYFSSSASIDLYSLVGDLLPDSTANVSFLVYANQDFAMNVFSYDYSSYSYDYLTETTSAPPKVLDSVITTYTVSAVPETNNYALLFAGLVVLTAVVRRQH